MITTLYEKLAWEGGGDSSISYKEQYTGFCLFAFHDFLITFSKAFTREVHLVPDLNFPRNLSSVPSDVRSNFCT